MVWINEFHYDNNSGDVGEFVEIAAAAGTDLTGWTIALYNGSSTQRSVYDTLTLSGIVSNQQNGFGTISVPGPANGIQNGSPDGLALVRPDGSVAQFLSYEGSFVAASGPAAGMTSTDIGASQPSTAPIGSSVGLTGTGDKYADFTWQFISDDTPGGVNSGQTFQGGGSTPSLSVNDVAVLEGDNGTVDLVFTVSLSQAATDAVTVDYATADGTATAGSDYAATSGTLTFEPGVTQQQVTVTVNGDTEIEQSETLTLELSNAIGADLADASGEGTIVTDDIVLSAIHDVQGSAFFSPVLAAEGISAFNVASAAEVKVQGVVTALDTFGSVQGFYISEEQADWDASALTSEGIFVRTMSTIAGLTLGETVTVTANVTEYQDFSNLNRTYLVDASSILQANDNVALPTLVLDGTAGRAIPNRITSDDNPDFTDSEDNAGDTFDPANDALDFYETIEGMRVTVTDMVVADGFVAGSDDFVRFNAYSTDHANPEQLNSRGGYTISGDPQFYPVDTAETGDDVIRGGRHLHDGDNNPDIIELDFGNVGRGGTSSFDELLTMGDRLGDVTGILDFDFGVTKLFVTDALDAAAVANLDSSPGREVTELTGDDARSLRVATYNVENLSPVGTVYDERGGAKVTSQEKFDKLANDIDIHLDAPDIIIVEEVQDNNGVDQTGTRDASQTWEELVAAVNAKTGKTYSWVDETPTENPGGAPGGNIRVGFLYDTARVQLGDLAADATIEQRRKYTDAIGDGARDAGDLIAFDDSQLGGEVNAADWSGTRKSILGEFTFNGNAVYVVGSHLPSKSGSGQTYQINQNIDEGQPANGDWGLRNTLGQDLYAMQNLISQSDADNRVLHGGDMNEFWFYRPLEVLTGYATPAGEARIGGERYVNLMVDNLSEAERFSYDFNGRSQALDTILADQALAGVGQFDAVHINSGYNGRTGAVDPASSDHDPSLAEFDFRSFGERVLGTGLADTIEGFAGDDHLAGLGGNDQLFGGAGNDRLNGGFGDDVLTGGSGDDTYFVGGGGTVVEEADGGYDRVVSPGLASVTLADNVEELLQLAGSIEGIGNGGDNRLLGSVDDNILSGLGGRDILRGRAGNDDIDGGEGADRVIGDAGDDVVRGGGGNDIVAGGAGTDELEGGLGADWFFFEFGDANDSDTIADFDRDQGDKINLRQVDANSGFAGNQDFTFIGTDGFSGTAGELRFSAIGGDVFLQGDTDGLNGADFQILVRGVSSLTVQDILGANPPVA